MAIQMIIHREFGLNKTDNPMQGSFIYEELAHLVEEAVLSEFEAISDKGGVLGAMESMYQRSKIQDESIHYESLKDSGELPIIGVNTYLAEDIKQQMEQEIELTRCSYDEKEEQIKRLRAFHEKHKSASGPAIERLKAVAESGGNIFEELLDCVQTCSLGQITQALFEVGGRYRRNV
jgi:isobutyryl-CoA mutase